MGLEDGDIFVGEYIMQHASSFKRVWHIYEEERLFAFVMRDFLHICWFPVTCCTSVCLHSQTKVILLLLKI